uniref:Uncharacterized protein n=1 Tax=Arundo donax TaxID=35708 RepID=A0A0A8Z191_ARUDO
MGREIPRENDKRNPHE